MTGSQNKLFGRGVRRLEDPALVTGRGRYVDDLRPQGCLAAAFARSPHAHARFSSIDSDAARQMPGVIAIYTIDDLRPHLTADKLAVGLPSAAIRFAVDRPILAAEEVVYVGEPVALIIAETRQQAEDAVDALDIDYEPLPAVADCRAALDEGAPPVHSSLPDNLLATMGFAYGDSDAAFAAAAHVTRGSYWAHRGGSHSLEGRAVLATPDAVTGELTVWSSTQTPTALKKSLCELLDREEQTVRVLLPDIGGAFGPKLVTYPEEIAVAAAAVILGRSVKWIEDRREHFISTTQERDQHWDMEMALGADGTILGIRGKLLHDHGAYTARGLNVPYGSGITLPLPYNVPAYRLDVNVVLTNMVPVTPVRGAGQPQAAFVMERLLDRAASELGLDRTEIRRRNLVRADQMPCTKPLKLRGGTHVILDSGDYPATQGSALQAAGWEDFPKRKAEARNEGRLLGIGLANYVEGTGRGPYESVRVRIGRSGKVIVSTAAASMGQGTQTMIAQIVGEQLGGDMSLISVKTGDTDGTLGFGGFNSRQTVIAGASAFEAALTVRRKLLKVASHLMEADADDLEIVGGKVELKGVPGKSFTFAQLAAEAASLPGFQLPGIDSPGLDSTQQVIINDMAFSNGTAVAEVAVDADTGRVEILRIVLAHDCGRMVNPMTVDGQIIGGMAHGVGNTLYEQMLFDDAAQPLTTTFADYLMVTAAEMPPIEIIHRESPSPLNALGVKGVGESGTIPVAGAVMSAIDDALSHLNVHVERTPISPQALRERISAAMQERSNA